MNSQLIDYGLSRMTIRYSDAHISVLQHRRGCRPSTPKVFGPYKFHHNHHKTSKIIISFGF